MSVIGEGVGYAVHCFLLATKNERIYPAKSSLFVRCVRLCRRLVVVWDERPRDVTESIDLDFSHDKIVLQSSKQVFGRRRTLQCLPRWV